MLSIKNKIGVLLLLVYCTNGTLLTSEGMYDSHDDTDHQPSPNENGLQPSFTNSNQQSPQPSLYHSLINNVQPTPTESNQIFTKARHFLGCVLPAALVTPAALAFAKGQPIVDSNRIGKAVANFWQGATTYLPCLADTANWAHVPVFLSAQVAASYGLHTYFYTDKRIKKTIDERYRSKCFFYNEESNKDELRLYDLSPAADSNTLKKGLNLASFQNASITLIKDEGLQNNSSNQLKTIEDYVTYLNETYKKLDDDQKNHLEGNVRVILNSAYTEFMREFFYSEIKYSSFNKHAATNIGVTALLLALAYLYKKENLSLKTNATIFIFSTAISVYYSFILASFTNEKIAKIAKETIYTNTEISDTIKSNSQIEKQIIRLLIHSMKNAKTYTL